MPYCPPRERKQFAKADWEIKRVSYDRKVSLRPFGDTCEKPEPTPITVVPNSNATLFAALVEEWDRATGMSSSYEQSMSHPAYLKIIKMRDRALPYILRDLETGEHNWFRALEVLTNCNPAVNAKDFDEAAVAWQQWGRKTGWLR